uniref:Uncharacterized protein n=1 Tax=Eutreptiella gymnastica TaxID=73025 RepID=A0A7S4CAP9_9EUGL|mmetsp:Transcript_77413/g.129915  ORF Transcript_77413/g.129915 Transcript_77413/m.129915 type:complete len:109 (-) Transcript_77413:55-381(-)
MFTIAPTPHYSPASSDCLGPVAVLHCTQQYSRGWTNTRRELAIGLCLAQINQLQTIVEPPIPVAAKPRLCTATKTLPGSNNTSMKGACPPTKLPPFAYSHLLVYLPAC